MPNMITRCPKCATAFRISDTLLGTAKGMVRCGSCLNVFNALDHLESKAGTRASRAASSPNLNARPDLRVPQPPVKSAAPSSSTSTVTPTSQASASVAPKTANETSRPQSAPISISGFLKQQEASVGAQRSTKDAIETTPGSLFERPWAAQTSKLKKTEEPDSDADESWALELLKDDDEELPKTSEASPAPKPGLAKPENEAKPDIAARVEAVPNTLAPVEAAIPAKAEHRLESLVEKTPSEIKKHTEPKASEPIKPKVEEAEVGREEETSFYKKEPFEDDHFALTVAEKMAPEKPEFTLSEPSVQEDSLYNWAEEQQEHHEASSSEPNESQSGAALRDVIAAIEPEPLELEWSPKVSLSRRLLWPFLALAALLLLLTQVAWLEFNRLNRVEPYRSFYAVVCQPLQCTLPELIDRSKIQTYNLVVRSHPEAANALIMDVILQNNAAFEQTFPVLLLTFSNLENETVASRRLTPSEYLGGEMAGVDKMPIKQPIHIAIEIVDPGPDVPNYSITITD